MSPLAEMIEGLLLKGCTRHLVDAAIDQECKTEPKPTKAEIDAAYAECLDTWVNTAEDDSDKVHAFHLRSRRYLYQRSMQINDFKTCLAILKDLAKLEQAYEHQKKTIKDNEEEQTEEGHYLRLIHGKRSADNGKTVKATGKGRRRQSARANS
jgi:hypothetical protein